MGIGLGVDYSLFVISRFREALGRGSSVRDALVETLNTAGRTVVFSGLTVATSLAVLLAFPFPFLQSFGYAGILVVVTAVIGALVVLPAALAMIGQRAVRRGVTPRPPADIESGGWYRVGTAVMRRPLLFGGLALAVVLALAAPALGTEDRPARRPGPPGRLAGPPDLRRAARRLRGRGQRRDPPDRAHGG